MISEQVKEIREYADSYYKADFGREGIVKVLRQAADTIEALSAKLSAANMERSETYYNDSCIPCKERLPEVEKFYIVTYKFDDEKDLRCHELYYGIADNDIEAGWYIDDDCTRLYKQFTVIAWQPLPESYKT